MKLHLNPALAVASSLCLLPISCTSFTSYSPDAPAEPSGKSGEAAEPVLVPEVARTSLGVPYFLPRGFLLVRGEFQKSATAGEKKYVITVSQVTRADARAPQFLRIRENAMYDEKSQIKVQNGLLTTVNAEPNDRTADIIKTVVGTALDVMKIAAKAAGPMGAPVAPDPEQEIPEFGAFDVEIDPFSTDSCMKANKQMAAAGWNFILSGWGQEAPLNKPLQTVSEASQAKQLRKEDPKAGYASPGPVYRLPTPVVIQLVPIKNFKLPANVVSGGEGAPNRPEFVMPVPGTYAYVPVKRGFMTQRTTNVGFSQGMPTDVSLTQPSPVLAAVKLPADIVKMVGEALPAIVKVENKAAPVTALDQIKAENAMLEQQLKQLEFEKKIRDLGGTP